MNTKRTFFACVIALLMALQASAMPIPYRINGTELASSTRYLPEMMIADFLEGAIWAPVSDVSSVDIDYVKTRENYSVGCFKVHYRSEAKRPSEYYVITYKVEEKGIIDAVLAFVDKDITLCRGDFMFRDRIYQLESGGSKCEQGSKDFSVVRSYRAMMGNEGGDLLSEKGDITRHYTIDDKGLITPDATLTTDATWTREPNRSIPGRQVGPNDAEHEKIDKSRVLGPGMEVLNLYATPLHQALSTKDFGDILGWTKNIEKQLGAKYSEPLAQQVKLWQERAAYRNSPKSEAPKKGKKAKKSRKRK